MGVNMGVSVGEGRGHLDKDVGLWASEKNEKSAIIMKAWALKNRKGQPLYFIICPLLPRVWALENRKR